jgi:hypothetical protein
MATARTIMTMPTLYRYSSSRGRGNVLPFITSFIMVVWLPEFSGRWKGRIFLSLPPTLRQFVIFLRYILKSRNFIHR